MPISLFLWLDKTKSTNFFKAILAEDHSSAGELISAVSADLKEYIKCFFAVESEASNKITLGRIRNAQRVQNAILASIKIAQKSHNDSNKYLEEQYLLMYLQRINKDKIKKGYFFPIVKNRLKKIVLGKEDYSRYSNFKNYQPKENDRVTKIFKEQAYHDILNYILLRHAKWDESRRKDRDDLLNAFEYMCNNGAEDSLRLVYFQLHKKLNRFSKLYKIINSTIKNLNLLESTTAWLLLPTRLTIKNLNFLESTQCQVAGNSYERIQNSMSEELQEDQAEFVPLEDEQNMQGNIPVENPGVPFRTGSWDRFKQSNLFIYHFSHKVKEIYMHAKIKNKAAETVSLVTEGVDIGADVIAIVNEGASNLFRRFAGYINKHKKVVIKTKLACILRLTKDENELADIISLVVEKIQASYAHLIENINSTATTDVNDVVHLACIIAELAIYQTSKKYFLDTDGVVETAKTIFDVVENEIKNFAANTVYIYGENIYTSSGKKISIDAVFYLNNPPGNSLMLLSASDVKKQFAEILALEAINHYFLTKNNAVGEDQKSLSMFKIKKELLVNLVGGVLNNSSHALNVNINEGAIKNRAAEICEKIRHVLDGVIREKPFKKIYYKFKKKIGLDANSIKKYNKHGFDSNETPGLTKQTIRVLREKIKDALETRWDFIARKVIQEAVAEFSQSIGKVGKLSDERESALYAILINKLKTSDLVYTNEDVVIKALRKALIDCFIETKKSHLGSFFGATVTIPISKEKMKNYEKLNGGIDRVLAELQQVASIPTDRQEPRSAYSMENSN